MNVAQIIDEARQYRAYLAELGEYRFAVARGVGQQAPNIPSTYAELLTKVLPQWRVALDAAGGRWKPNQPDGTYSPPDPVVLLRALRSQPTN